MEILFIILVIAVVAGVFMWGRSIEANERAPEDAAPSLTVLHDLGRGKPARDGSRGAVARELMVSLGVARLRDDGTTELPRMVAERPHNGVQRLSVSPLPGTMRLWRDDAVRVELSNVLGGIPMHAEVLQEDSGKLVLTWRDGPSSVDSLHRFDPDGVL